jgi:DNA-binding transcriptional regulator YiaG
MTGSDFNATKPSMTPAEVKAWRAHWRISQSQLARLLGVTTRTVAHWEGGTAPPPAYLDLALETLARREAATLLDRAAAAGPLETATP